MNNEKSGVNWGKAVKELCWFLSVLFTALRAANVIDWGWFWLMLPIFASWTVGTLAAAALGIYVAQKMEEEKED